MQVVDQGTLSFEEKKRRLQAILAQKAAAVKEVPASFAQQSLWLLQELGPESSAYHIREQLFLKGLLDVAGLGWSLTKICERHQSLRTRFRFANDVLLQQIHQQQALELELFDLSGLDPAQRLDQAQRLCQALNQQPFRLDQGPLLRLQLIRLDAQEHQLQIVLHHIIADGLSLRVCLAELFALYTSFVTRLPTALAPLTLQYADYSTRQRQQLTESFLQAEVAWWQETLVDAPPLSALAHDRPRPGVQRFRGASHSFALAAEPTSALLDTGRQHGATPFMSALASFAALLARYGNTYDLVLGTPIAGRPHADLQPLIGLFANSLVLRLKLAPSMDLSALLRHVRSQAASAFAHADCPFEHLVQNLGVSRDPGYNPLFQVAFTYRQDLPDQMTLPLLSVSAPSSGNEMAKFDLHLDLAHGARGLQAHLIYNSDLFDAASIHAMAEHYQTLLSGLLDQPGQELAQLNLLSAEERARLLQAWSPQEVAPYSGACLHEFFAANAARWPDALAVAIPDAPSCDLSYAQLEERVNRLSRALVARGLRPGQIVGLAMARDAYLVPALLAILQSGAGYLPLDPHYPKTTLAYILDDASPQLILSTEPVAADLPESACPVLLVDRLLEQPEPDGLGRRAVAVGPEVPAYIIYTSGSTGRPKGTMLSHAMVGRLFETTAAFGFDERDVWTLFHAYAFDFSVWEIWGALRHGGSLVVVPQTICRAPDRFYQLLLDHQVTVLNQTPAAFEALIAASADQDPNLLRLRLVIFGGEALNLAGLRPWFERHGETQPLLVNMYGITETCVHVTWRKLNASDCGLGCSPIGTALADLGCYVLDPLGQLCPSGVPGELHISGPGLAFGYLGKPALTAQRFVPHPYALQTGERLYRSGDLARFRHDGELLYLGRIDHQVKIRGYRIELGEIETVLNQAEQVRKAVVLTQAGTDGLRLVAYVQVEGSQDPKSLRAFLKQKLPDHMVPSLFVVVTIWPLTSNGKLDRARLPKAEAPTGTFVAAEGPLERALAEIWAEVLDLDQVSATANFFELGGHSLSATRVVARVRSRLQLDCNLQQMFSHPSLRELASVLASQTATPRHRLCALAEGMERPLSAAQQRLWFLDRLEGPSATYNIPAALQLEGLLHIEKLQQALDQLCQRHESLRSCFPEHDGQARLSVRPQGPRIELCELANNGDLGNLVRAHARQPFDLATGPLLRLSLVQREAQSWLCLINMHHIISDGWSVGLFIEELAQLYQAACEGRANPLKPLPLQYADYAFWQNQHTAVSEQKAYWLDQLRGIPKLHELATDRPRPALQTAAGQTLYFRVPAEVLGRLQGLASRAEATLFMVLQTALSGFLARYSHQTDIVSGTAVANRHQAEAEGLIGLFVNTLALRLRVQGDPNFTTLLAQVKTTTLAAFAHSQLPFEQVVEACCPARDLSHSPIYQILLVLQNAPSRAIEVPGLKLTVLEPEETPAKLDLSLILHEDGEDLRGSFTYNSDLFEQNTILAMISHFQHLLAHVAEQPESRLSTWTLLDADQRRALLHDWNQDHHHNDPEVLVHELFLAQAERRPETPALVMDRHPREALVLNYATLAERARGLAASLSQAGVGPDQLVGVYCQRGPEQIVAILASILAGAAYLPLDPSYPPERLAQMCADAAVHWIVCQPGLAPQLGEAELIFSDAWTEPRALPRVAPLQLAYAIYTSGSTGKPKGTLIHHQGLSLLVQNQIRIFGLGPGRRALQFASICFDASVSEIFTALCSGATLVMAEAEALLPGPDFVALLDRQRVEVATLPPVVLANLPESELPYLRTLVTAGDVCPIPIATRFAKGRRLINGYGPTETTVGISMSLCPGEGRKPLLGRHLDGVTAYVLDPAMEPVPAGIPGELYAGGLTLARAYHGRAAQTAERFVPDPFGGQGGARLYRTGDLVRYHRDGSVGPLELEFIGRADFQVKLRGFRIEPGEIDAQLRQLDEVVEAQTLVREIGPGNEQLVAFVQLHGAFDPRQLRRALAAKLPAYMVPGLFVPLAHMPLGPNGKIDRNCLAQIDLPRETGTEVSEPRDATETGLVQIWSELLGREKVGIHDNFFELGGHSLLATRVASRIREQLGAEMSLKRLFAAPTIAELAPLVDEARSATTSARIQAAPSTSPALLSFAQQRLFFLNQLEGFSGNYNMPSAFRLVGRLQVRHLEASLAQLVTRHESLRSRFPELAGNAQLVVEPSSPVRLALIDLADSDRAEDLARGLARRESLGCFDLAAGPLWRACLVRLAPEVHLLLVTIHHIIGDGWSMALFVNELASLYQVASRQAEPQLDDLLPPLTLRYSDYAHWQRQQLTEKWGEQRRWWQEQLRDLPACHDLASDRPRPTLRSLRGGRLALRLDEALCARLEQLASQQGATLFMVLATSFASLLARTSNRSSFALGTPVANRSQRELEPIFGLFVNTLVLRFEQVGNPSFAALLQSGRNRILDAFAHADLPFEQVVEALAPERSLAHTPLFQVFFALQNTPMAAIELPGLSLQHQAQEETSAKFDLSVNLVVKDGALEGVLEYSSDLFEASSINRLSRHWTQFLEGLSRAPETRLFDLPISDAVELAQILVHFNQTEAALPDLCLHQLFQAQAARNPEQLALVWDQGQLSYSELVERVDVLSAQLLGQGVRPEQVLGICCERGPAQVVAMLACAQAGAAWLPIDPACPRERLDYLQADADLRLVLCGPDQQVLFPKCGLVLDGESRCALPLGPTESHIRAEPEQLAYVLYTSGTSGRPKGVQVCHAAIVNRVLWAQASYPLGNDDAFLHTAAFHFDIAIWEIMAPLVAGARLVLAPHQSQRDTGQLLDLIQRHQISAIHLIPSLLLALLEEAELERAATLKHLFTGGEALPLSTIQRFFERLKCQLHQFYGPTEAAISTTAVSCEPHANAVTIGRPIHNTIVRLLDRYGRPVPLGAPGELHLGGIALARAYAGKPGQTADRFRPFDGGPTGSRLYASGDLAKYREDGQLVFLGRVDFQIKIRGFRIEPQEIEAVLREQAAIREAVVLAWGEQPTRLVAYVTPELSPAERTDVELALAARLPEYMLPSCLIGLAVLPLLSNGKLDRAALPSPQLGGPAETFVAARTAQEQVLAKIWAELLGLEQVGIDDNFFALGGDSILTLQVIAKAREQGLHFTPKQIFEHQTIAQLVPIAAQKQLQRVPQEPVQGPLLALPIQALFLEHPRQSQSPFNQTLLLRPNQSLEPALLQAVLAALIEQHDMLRLRVDYSATSPQLLCGAVGEPLPFELCEGPCEPGRIQELQASLDLARGPIQKLVYFRPSADPASHRLLWTIHHLAVDGVSWRILLENFQAAYTQLLEGRPLHLAAKTHPFAHWSQRLHDWSATLDPSPWLALEAGAELVPDLASAANTYGQAEVVRCQLGTQQTERFLRQTPKAFRNRPDELLLTALAQALVQPGGPQHILIDLESHGREDLFEDLDLSRTVGWFTAVYPVALEGRGDLEADLKHNKERVRAVAHGGLGFGLLQQRGRLTGPQPTLAFNYLGQTDRVLQSGLFEVAPEATPGTTHPLLPRRHLLEVTALIGSGQLQLAIQYSTNHHRRASVQALLDRVQARLERLIDFCADHPRGGLTPSDLPLLDLSQESLERLDQALAIETIYPLSPTQEGMFFHARFDERVGSYFTQVSARFQGPLHQEAFRAAWDQVASRHAVLRTAFDDRHFGLPVQLVYKQRPLAWTLLDWRDMPKSSHETLLETFKAEDRLVGFQLDVAPLLRFALIQTDAAEFRFVLSMHHLILDGWSLPIVLGEVFSAYRALTQGTSATWPSVQPYERYIAWLRRRDPASGAVFWAEQLAGFEAATPLPGEPHQVLGRPQDYAERELLLGGPDWIDLQDLARQQRLTQSSLIQGAWALLLSLYAGQSQVVFGLTVAGRPAELAGADRMVGLFINTLPLRADCQASQNLHDWLQSLQKQRVASEPHAASALVEIQAQISNGAPLFESIVVFENYPIASSMRQSEPGLAIDQVAASEQNNYPLTLTAGPGAALSLKLSFDQGRISSALADRLLQHLAGFLRAMSEHGNRPLGQLPRHGVASRADLLAQFQQTQVQAWPQGLAALIEARAARDPEVAAVRFEDESTFLSLAELNRRANRVAHRLIALGVGLEDLVGFSCTRSSAMLAGLLGILKSGAAYVPIDPSYPSERIAYMLEDAQVKLVLSDDTAVGGGTTLQLEALIHEAGPDENSKPLGEAANLAYVIYTSGSTGKPKGVQIQRGAMANFLYAMAQAPGLGADDSLLAVTTISFDIAVLELYLPLLCSARLVIASSASAADGLKLSQLLDQAEINVMQATPATWNLLRAAGWKARAGFRALCGGEALNSDLAAYLLADGAVLWNLYGPTETTVWSTARVLTAECVQAGAQSVGTAVANTTLHVVDAQLRLLPAGITGELLIGGSGLSRGYRNRPGQTACQFVPDSLNQQSGARLYRSGDRVVHLPDQPGHFAFLGRIDHQIKLRGYRIETGEIETVLGQGPGVKRAHVVVYEQVLLAYVEGVCDDFALLREHVAALLPAYMRPNSYYAIEIWPLTPNGKLDRAALVRQPRDPLTASTNDRALQPPRNPREALLLTIWKQVLKREDFGIHDNFFELGGHSLLATRVFAQLSAETGRSLALRHLFEAPTVAELAQRLSGQVSGWARPALRPQARPDQPPLSFAQQRLWFLHQIEGLGGAYNMPFALKLEGQLHRSALEQAIAAIVARHEALRTRFPSAAGQPYQQVQAHCHLVMAELDLGDWETQAAQAEVRRLATLAATQVFDLEQGPLFHVSLLILGPSSHVLLLTLHHIISDGWSIGVLIAELAAFYRAFHTGEAVALAPLAVQYQDYAIWQRSWLDGAVLAEQLAYWQEHLRDMPSLLELPYDRPRPKLASYRGASLPLALDQNLSSGLAHLARQHNASLFMVLQTLFDILLMHYSRRTDIVSGTPVANRVTSEVEPLIGFFVNTLVLRCDLSGDPSFEQSLARVKATAMAAFEHQDIPFEQVVESLQPERSTSHSPLFQVLFVLQNAPAETLDLPELSLSQVEMGHQHALFDLRLSLSQQAEGVRGHLEFSTDLFEAATIARLGRHFQNLCASVLERPQARLSQLSLLDEAERRGLIETYQHFPTAAQASIVTTFEACAERHGQAVALCLPEADQRTCLSYAELNQAANRIAHQLLELGVGPEQPVGLAVDRSLEMVIGLLAILKAGACYVPLDPHYPAERLAFMMADAGLVALLSSSSAAAELPEHELPCLFLDQACTGSALNPNRKPDPQHPAYIIYTSGSTGKPKGVVLHHAAVIDLLDSCGDFVFDQHDSWTLFHSYAFDFSVWELWGALLRGGRLVIVPYLTSRDPERFYQLLADEEITVLNQTPTAFYSLVRVDERRQLDLALRLVIFGGEALNLLALEPWFSRHGDAKPQLVNMYGITETCVHVTRRSLTAQDLGSQSLIGPAIADLQTYLVDPHLNLSPVGVPGEIVVAGLGLARGYLKQAALTAQRFVPNPFGPVPGSRLYRSGDLARFNPTGEMIYLGRLDFQVKVRGFRIELGEIEAVLAAHPHVAEAHVAARMEQDQTRLVAYVVVDAADEVASQTEEVVGDWESVFQNTYREAAPAADPTRNIIGWNDSFSGAAIPAEEMFEWLDASVARILALKPKRVLEIGCGTGMILFAVAPHSESYQASDLSAQAIAYVHHHLPRLDLEPERVELFHQPGHLFAPFAARSRDTVILNSVIQYFPSIDYLVEVLAGAINCVGDGGRVFLGDLRNLDQIESFHSAITCYQLGEDDPNLLARIGESIRMDAELVIAPSFFRQLQRVIPRIAAVRALVKRGQAHNELSRFRYDVILEIGPSCEQTPVPLWQDWSEHHSLENLRPLLQDPAGPDQLAFSGVPNARLIEETCRVARLQQRPEPCESWVDPEAWWALCDGLGYEVELRLHEGGDGSRYDVVLNHQQRHPARVRVDAPELLAATPNWREHANNPMLGKRIRALVPSLRKAARESLPDYMVPAAFVVLEAMPLTSHGKIDRRKLPQPQMQRITSHERPLNGPSEIALAEIWAEVLGLERVGATADFFELGGHSLLATRVLARISERFGVEPSLRALFEHASLEQLAAHLDQLSVGSEQGPALLAVRRDHGDFPLSAAQQRLWFLARLEGPSATYNMPLGLELRGTLVVAALEQALASLVDRHEVLRARFYDTPEGPRQQFDRRPTALVVEDGSALDATGLQRRLNLEANQPFDLHSDAPLRTLLIRHTSQRHTLLFTMHHIVSDGWSMGLVVRELGELYSAFVDQRPARLAPLAVQYGDYAVWQADWLGGSGLSAQLDYWCQQLAGAPAHHDLPTDRPRPQLQSANGAAWRVNLGPQLSAALNGSSRQAGVTLFMTLQAAFAALIARYSGSSDILIGTPVANRNRREVEGLIGFFVNTLVLRNDLSGDPDLAGLLARSKPMVLDALCAAAVPFEQIVEAVRPSRDLSHSPLFQIMFALQNLPESQLETPGLSFSLKVGEKQVSRFELSLQLGEGPDGLAGEIEYNRDLFDEASIARLAQHYQTLLKAWIAQPQSPLSKLDLLDADERAQILECWNGSREPEPEPALLPHQFEAVARQHAEQTALIYDDGQSSQAWTYAQLNGRINGLAQRLTALGAGPETLVAVCLGRSTELIVALRAVLQAGAAYLALDPSYPRERLAYMLADARPCLLISEPALADHLPEHELPLVVPDPADLAEVSVLPALDPANLAYVIYTSGSTGKPKGTLLCQRGAANLLRVQRQHFQLGPQRRVLQFASSSFDACTWEILMALGSGASLCVAPASELLPGPALHGLMLRQGITHATLPPSALAYMGEAALPELTHLITAGEACSAELVTRFAEGRQFFNAYGPTETTVCTTLGPCQSGSSKPSIGRALGNLEVYVLDRHLQPVPVGVVGQLYAAGLGLARAYHRRGALSAEKFLPHPFSPEPGQRLYATGDLARWLPDGQLDFLGRADQQIKLRGFRIEPAEIEQVLLGQAQIQSAVVRKAKQGDFLVAWYVGELAPAELRAYASARLPAHLVPAVFMAVAAIPLSPNGKIDLSRLPDPDQEARSYRAPEGATEEQVAAIWSKLLERERVGRDDNFFEIGGHSLLATRVLTHLQEHFAVELALVEVFHEPTVTGLAAAIERQLAQLQLWQAPQQDLDEDAEEEFVL